MVMSDILLQLLDRFAVTLAADIHPHLRTNPTDFGDISSSAGSLV